MTSLLQIEHDIIFWYVWKHSQDSKYDWDTQKSCLGQFPNLLSDWLFMSCQSNATYILLRKYKNRIIKKTFHLQFGKWLKVVMMTESFDLTRFYHKEEKSTDVLSVILLYWWLVKATLMETSNLEEITKTRSH